MKLSKLKTSTIIVSSIVAVLLILVLIFSFITLKPLENITGYSYVVLKDSSKEVTLTKDTSDKILLERYNSFTNAFAGTGFSMIHAIFEGKFNTSSKFETYKDAKDDDKVKKVETTVPQYVALAAPTGGYMVTFNFSELKKMTIEKKELSFNQIKILYTDTSGEIGTVKMYVYNTDTKADQVEYVIIDTIIAYANTSGLIIASENILTGNI